MILVTGGTGLVGAHLLYDLITQGKEVKAIKRNNSNIEITRNIFSYYSQEFESLFSKVEWVDADLMDFFSLEDAMKDVDYIYHCAAIVSYNPKEHEKMLNVNIDGTANIVNVALRNKIKKLCFVSSIAALGNTIGEELITESTYWKSAKRSSKYSISKYGAEREVWRGIEEGLNAVIVNPSVILGSGNWNNGSSKLFTTVWNGLKFYTNGMTGFVDVRDVVKAMIMLMESEVINQKYLLSSENVNYINFFGMVAKYLNKDAPKYKATRFMSEFGWRFEKLRGFILNKSPLITRETAKAANTFSRFSNEKIKKEFSFEFLPVATSVKEICENFLKYKNRN
ncbi:MAG: NAD-dependent epimerase/dehydratase family protein [Bacteroidetes bacterium]|nr:NAD-dependent epimerase/dehydratase family protein [Bacteroidota bacterium]